MFGSDMESMMRATEIITEADPEVVDINYGCPVKAVVCRMAGSGILRDVPKMIALTEAVVKSTHKPVTVKTRLGWDEGSINIEEVAERLQDIGIKALSIHARTRSQMYKGEADWSWIAKVKNNPRIKIPIFGNGDIDSPEKAKLYRERYGVDGIMIGRAAIGYPWIFREIKHYFATGEKLAPPTVAERVAAAREHLHRSIEWKGARLGIIEMRRHYTNYFKGYEGIKNFRAQLVTLEDADELNAVLTQLQDHYENLASAASADVA